MGRPQGELTRCGGEWTEAKWINFVKNQLRSGTRKWAPIQRCKKKANIERGLYRCAGCGQAVPPTMLDDEKGRRVTNIFVDHIEPVVDPNVGFTTWDSFVNGLYCEEENLQLLCGACHKVKSQEEIDIATARRKKDKDESI
jgi:hypothetical protein